MEYILIIVLASWIAIPHEVKKECKQDPKKCGIEQVKKD